MSRPRSRACVPPKRQRHSYRRSRHILTSVGLFASLTGLTLLANAASVVILLVAVLVWIIALVKLIRTFAGALDRSDDATKDAGEKES